MAWKFRQTYEIICLNTETDYGAFSHDVTAAMLVFPNKDMAAMMVYQTNPAGIELYFDGNTSFGFTNPIWLLVTWVKTLHFKAQ